MRSYAWNAVKFTNGGSVTLCVRVDDAPRASSSGAATTAPGEACGEMALLFEVVDTGHGISAEAQRRLFQPFEQAHSGAPDGKWGGTGLGLSSACLCALVLLCALMRLLLCT